MTLQKAIEMYLSTCYRQERKFTVIFRGQDTAYGANLQIALRQAVLLSFMQLYKSGRFFPVYVKENKTSRIICRLENREKILELAEEFFDLQLKEKEQVSLVG